METRPMAGANEPACPLCGEPAPVGTRRCDNCGAALDAGSEALRRFATSRKGDAGAGPRDDPGAPPTEPGKGGTLYLCPTCGAFVSSADATCSHCGASLGEEGGPTPAEGRPCPHCGATIHLAAEMCPACGRPVDPVAAAEEIPTVCPECGSLAPTGRQTCAVCRTSLRPGAVKPATPPELPPERPARVVPRAVAPQPVAPRPRAAAPPPKPAAARAAPPRSVPSAPSEARKAKPSTMTKVPPRPPVRRPTIPPDETRAGPVSRIRELTVVGSAIALPVAAAASYGNLAGHEWGEFFLFGVLFGIGAFLLAPDLRPLVRRLDFLLFAGGTALLAAGPLLAYLGGSSRSIDAPLAVVGAVLLGLAAWRQRSGVGPLLPWTAGLLLLAALAYAPLAGVPPGPSEIVLWGIGGGMTLGAATFTAVRRWVRSVVEARIARADSESARREYEKSIASYDAAIALARRAGRESAAAWYGKGSAFVAAGRYTDAVAALDRALAANPENEIAWINKGTALSRLGRMNDALKCYNSALKVNPIYEVAWNNKGNALARLGRYEFALECYARALEIDGGYRTAWVNKGFVLAKLGRFEEAAECADTALRLTDGAAASA